MTERAGVVEQTYVPAGPDERRILAEFDVTEAALLGSGGEARIFALDEARVLRIQAPNDSPADRELATLLDSWANSDLGFGLPRMLSQYRLGSQNFSIERRLSGVPLARWLAQSPDPGRRRTALIGLLDAAARLRTLPLPRRGFGRVLGDPRRFGTLADLLAAQIEVGLGFSGGLLAAAVPGLDRRVRTLVDELAGRAVSPAFCHADLAPANVMVDGAGRVTAVLDISVHALAADPVLDQVGAVAFLEMTPYDGNLADAGWLQEQLIERLGPDAWLVDAYRRYYALYYAMDHGLIPWCAKQLLAPEVGPRGRF